MEDRSGYRLYVPYMTKKNGATETVQVQSKTQMLEQDQHKRLKIRSGGIGSRKFMF